jgi:methionyl-tRNA formyltransferase
MRFAYAGIDFLSDAFVGLVAGGWEPVKLFTRPCDGLHDVNEQTVAEAARRRLPIQMSRVVERDLDELALLGCDCLVVAGYPWRIRGWEGRVAYAFNFHPSPLPEGRGPYPLYRAILDGRESWGMSAHVLDADFDTGAVLDQEIFPLSPAETHETLLSRCQMATRRIGLRLAQGHFSETGAAATPQVGGVYYPRAHEDDRRLDFSRPVAEILRRVRAFGRIETIAMIGASQVHVLEAHGWQEAHDRPIGTIVHQYRRTLVVAAADGFVAITRWSPVSADAGRNFGR